MSDKMFCSWRKILLPVLSMIVLAAGCRGAAGENDIAGKTYIYEKEGFGGDFTIKIEEDGTFQYYEGPLSSYIGMGEWSLEGNILCLTDDGETINTFVNYFKFDGNALVFIDEKSSNFMYIKVSDGERFTEMPEDKEVEKKKREQENSGNMEEKSDNLTVREYADLLEEAGIIELTGENIAEIEKMIEGMPEEVVEALEPSQVPAFLLTAVGKGEYDFDEWTWTPGSRQVYSFDLEAFDFEKMYTYFLEGVSAINEGEFELTQIKEEVSGGEIEEETEGEAESHTIQFCYNGTEYAYEAEAYYDWFDTGMLDFMNRVLEKEGNPKRLYWMGDGYQECIVLYCAPKWADSFYEITGCRLDCGTK